MRRLIFLAMVILAAILSLGMFSISRYRAEETEYTITSLSGVFHYDRETNTIAMRDHLWALDQTTEIHYFYRNISYGTGILETGIQHLDGEWATIICMATEEKDPVTGFHTAMKIWIHFPGD